jgi:hypothetical protein
MMILNLNVTTLSLMMMMIIMIEMDHTAGLLKKCLEYTLCRHFKMSSCTLSKIVIRESCTIALTTITGLTTPTTNQYVAFFPI